MRRKRDEAPTRQRGTLSHDLQDLEAQLRGLLATKVGIVRTDVADGSSSTSTRTRSSTGSTRSSLAAAAGSGANAAPTAVAISIIQPGGPTA